MNPLLDPRVCPYCRMAHGEQTMCHEMVVGFAVEDVFDDAASEACREFFNSQ